MYFTYQYNAAATQANVLSDLIKLITGETNKANLSTDCNQAGTTILSTEAAGWAVYDAAAGTNIQCVRVLNQDGTTYKYVNLQVGTTTAISMAVAEAWNAVAHTGTNLSAYYASVWSSTGGGIFRGYVTPKNIVICSNSSGVDQAALVMHEITRDTIPAGYPCHFLLNSASGYGRSDIVAFTCPRIKTANAAGDTLNTAVLYGVATASVTALALSSGTHIYRDAAEIQKLATYKFGVAGSTAATGFQQYGTGYDILLTGAGAGNERDEIAIGGVTYVFVKAGIGAAALLVPKQ